MGDEVVCFAYFFLDPHFFTTKFIIRSQLAWSVKEDGWRAASKTSSNLLEMLVLLPYVNYIPALLLFISSTL